MKNADQDVVRLFLTTLMEDAGNILLGFFQSGAYSVMEKHGVNFTTEAEVKVDQFISQHLRDHFPSALILLKETDLGNEDFSSFAGAEECWIVNPLDGTTNFSRRDPNFSISIARLKKGSPDLGMVYLPVERKLYWAQSDRDGSFLNGERIRVSQTFKLGEMVVACGWAYGWKDREIMATHVQRLTPQVRQFKCMGSACADLAKMAEGKLDAYIHTGLKPWDVAAAGFICQKAGAFVRTISGHPYTWTPFEKTIFVTSDWGMELDLARLMFGSELTPDELMFGPDNKQKP